MDVEVLLDAGVVNRCRRRVHLDHDPAMREAAVAPPDPAAEQRMADAQQHRSWMAGKLRAGTSGSWADIPAELRMTERVRLTLAALREGVAYVWGAALPADGGRRGGPELLVRTGNGYVPVLVVRHRITDPGRGAWTTELPDLDPGRASVDSGRKVRSQPRDQLRLAHVRRLLEAAGFADPDSAPDAAQGPPPGPIPDQAQLPATDRARTRPPGRAIGGVIGLDADAVVWHDLRAATWPGGRGALDEYDERFADRLAVARAAAGRQIPLAEPSRVLECKHCQWWPVCEADLTRTRDVSLVVRGEDAAELRRSGVTTVDKLAALDPDGQSPIPSSGVAFADAVLLARAWLADLTVVRRVERLSVPRADVEVDIDMESFGDSGAYLWGCLLTTADGADIGVEPGYRAFATWDPLPTRDEANSFARFWAWLSDVRARTRRAGLEFRAYCYNALAENRWLYSSVERFGDAEGVPSREDVRSFVESDEWVDLFRIVSEQFLCSRGKGLKVVAPVAGFTWRDPEAGGEASMRWYRAAVGLDGGAGEESQRERLLRYNEDDVLATRALRKWISDAAEHAVPYVGDL